MTNDKPRLEPRQRRFSFLAAALAAIVVAGATTYAAIVRDEGPEPVGTAARSEPERPPVAVKAEVVERQDEPVIIDGLGTVQAWNTVTVRSQVDGTIEKIAFEEGAMVREGETLIELDARPFAAAVEQAKAKIKQDEAQLESAEQDLARTDKLQKSGYATRQLFDQQTATVAQLKSQVAADQAALKNAEAQLSFTVIKAPLSGRVGLRSVDIGNLVRDSDAGGIVTIMQAEPISVLFTAPEKYLDQINTSRRRRTLPIAAYSTDGQGLLAEGTLAVVDNTVDARSGTIRLKARFENTDAHLWPGQSVMTRLTIATLEDAVVVSEAAVQRGPNKQFVYVVTNDQTAEMRTVEVAQIQNGRAVISKGVQPGERVVTSGHYKVQPGAKLAVDLASSATKAAETVPPDDRID